MFTLRYGSVCRHWALGKASAEMDYSAVAGCLKFQREIQKSGEVWIFDITMATCSLHATVTNQFWFIYLTNKHHVPLLTHSSYFCVSKEQTWSCSESISDCIEVNTYPGRPKNIKCLLFVHKTDMTLYESLWMHVTVVIKCRSIGQLCCFLMQSWHCMNRLSYDNLTFTTTT